MRIRNEPLKFQDDMGAYEVCFESSGILKSQAYAEMEHFCRVPVNQRSPAERLRNRSLGETLVKHLFSIICSLTVS